MWLEIARFIYICHVVKIARLIGGLRLQGFTLKLHARLIE
jgi:hypothetical protein